MLISDREYQKIMALFGFISIKLKKSYSENQVSTFNGFMKRGCQIS